jgi:hypothetical protein
MLRRALVLVAALLLPTLVNNHDLPSPKKTLAITAGLPACDQAGRPYPSSRNVARRVAPMRSWSAPWEGAPVG